MKFSEIEEQDWPELQSYLDTCLLPLTCLTGDESPWETTKALEDLQLMMDLVEIPFKGRIVTYPSFHYNPDRGDLSKTIGQVSSRLKQGGFRYVILITANATLDELHVPTADLFITPVNLPQNVVEAKRKVGEWISALWSDD